MAMAMALTGAAPVRADGEFLQFDIYEGAGDGSLAISRGRATFGATFARYDGGRSGSVSLLWSVPVDGLGTLKLGPSLGRTDSDTAPAETELGVKIAFERWAPTAFGHLFLLGEYSTIDSAYFGLVQTGFGDSGIATEVSVGGSDTYSEVTAAVTKRIGEGPFVLRAGYKFQAGAAFAGFAINTF